MKYTFGKIAINSTAKKKPTEEDKYHYIGLEHLSSDTFDISNYGSDVAPTGEKLIMQKGDILFGKRRAYQKKVGISPIDGIFSAHGFVLRPRKEIINPEYFPFFIASNQFLETAIRISVGGLSPTVNWKDLEKQEFDLPSLSEQKILAEKLWAAYNLKESYKKMIEATDEMVKSRFIEMFGNPIGNEYKWPQSVLGECCEINPTRPKGISDDTMVSFIPMQDIYENGTTADFDIKPYSEVKKGFTYCANGDVLFAKITPCMENGKGAELNGLCNGIGMGSTEFHVLRQKAGVTNSTWLYYLTKLDVFRTDALKNMTGSGGQRRVPSSYLSTFKIGLPPVEQQNKFATIVQQADKSKFGDFKSRFIEMFGKCEKQQTIQSVCNLFIDGDWIEAKDQSESGIRLIQTGNVGDGVYLDKSDKARYITEETFRRLNCTEIFEGDILVSRLPEPVGRACVLPNVGKAITAVDCTIIRLKDIVTPEFFISFTQTSLYQGQIIANTAGSTRIRVSRSKLGEIKMPVPSIDEQKQFSDIVQQADKSKSVCQIFDSFVTLGKAS